MAGSLALKEFVHILVQLSSRHLSSGSCGQLPGFPVTMFGSYHDIIRLWFSLSPESSTFLVLDLKVGVAVLEGVDLLGAHGLVLVKLPHALNHAHHLVHAGLGPALGGGVAHEVLQTEGQSLNKGNIFVL